MTPTGNSTEAKPTNSTKEKPTILTKAKPTNSPKDLFCDLCFDLVNYPIFKETLMKIRGFASHHQTVLWYHRNNHHIAADK